MKTIKYSLIPVMVLLAFFAFLSGGEKYRKLPRDIEEMLIARPTPRLITGPKGKIAVLAGYDPMPDIKYMSQPLLRLAGFRILPGNNSRQRTLFYTDLTFINLENGKKKKISLPENARIGAIKWSFDGKMLAFLLYHDDKVELWGARAGQNSAVRLTDLQVNCTLSSGYTWMPNSNSILVTAVPENRGNPPEKSPVPEGPIIYETAGKSAKVRTYQDLLKDDFDEKLFDYYCTSQLFEINLKSGEKKKTGNPGIFSVPSPSPDGKYLLVYRIKKPYSYSVPYYYFTHSVEVWNRGGEVIRSFDLPLAEEVPIRGVPTGPREMAWRALKPATLVWVEALDGGDPKRDVPDRDKLMSLSAPFKGEPEEIVRIKNRFDGIRWLEGGKEALITEYDWKRRWTTTSLINVEKPGKGMQTVFDLSAQDVYNDPGDPVLVVSKGGKLIVPEKKGWIYLSGKGSSPEGDFPFLKRFNLKTKQSETLFRCRGENYEFFYDFAGNKFNKIVTRYESVKEPPNYFLINLKNGSRKALTDYPHPYPSLKKVHKELITYMREDSVMLSGTLYLPADYKKGERLPCVIWAYPREYSDPRIAGQVKGSPFRFIYLRGPSHLFFVTRGYAVLDNAQMPVVGDPETMNNTFVEQIVASARAAIDKLDSMGVIDRERVGIAGHSYGAFMTANLLAHSDLFAAGIARSGAYNRTLTPFGFQNERRTLWEAPDIYFKVSPFMHADKVNEPILLIHGEADNNSGTFPIQSKRFFHALKGHGATARLVLLPNESHGYRARESVEHVLVEMFDWFDKYVKNKPTAE